MKEQRLLEIKKIYEDMLLRDIIPFWVKNSLDKKNGGYYHYLNRDGTILNTDKSVWIQSRQVWVFSKLYNTIEKNNEWLDISTLGYNFIKKYCFDKDGRMFFQVTSDGKPLRKRRYWFSEAFTVIAFAEYAVASGKKDIFKEAKKLFKIIVDFYNNPSKLSPKVNPETRHIKSHAPIMILLATSQVLREVDNDDIYNKVIDQCIDDLQKYFFKKDKESLLEIVGKDGEIINNPEGRTINPGHSIETSWFLMHESMKRNDKDLEEIALNILNWSLEKGWDKKYGGLFSFIDIENKPTEKVEWDMKFWWPHCEALYALLLANYLTGDNYYEDWYEEVHDWSFKYFPDNEFGEWFGYLHRDGSVSLPVKGSIWKGPFHVPRFLLYGIELIEKILVERG